VAARKKKATKAKKPAAKRTTKAKPAAKAAKSSKARPMAKAGRGARAAARKAMRPVKAAASTLRKASRDLGRTVDGYIASVQGPLGEVAHRLNALVQEVVPTAKASIKWGQPVFEHNGPFAYFKAFKSYVNFGFWRGAELPDENGVLKGDGGRMRHVSLTDVASMPVDAIKALIRSAVEANERLGDPTRRK
jgi:hypothetical protein